MGDRLSVPFDRSYRVAQGKLPAGRYPGDKSKPEAIRKLTRSLGQGIRHFVNLMELTIPEIRSTLMSLLLHP